MRAIEKKTSYRNREIVIVQHKTGDDAGMDRLLAAVPCQRVCYEGPFNFARMNNLGAASASGDILLFLNDDVKPLAPGWLTSLVAQAQRPEVGAVGAKLLYPSGTIQHVGIAIGIMDACGHPLRRTCGSAFWPWLDLTRNVSAVTGACLAIRKSVFHELRGFDERFLVNYSDADLCLRARQAGYEVIYEPSALLRHRECGTRSAGTRYEERDLCFRRWAAVLAKGDPFYNPNLTTVREDGSLRLEL
jgi:GT2 family glycosyltransferase